MVKRRSSPGSFNRLARTSPAQLAVAKLGVFLFCAHGGSRFHGRTGTAVAGTFSASAGSLEGLNTDAGLFSGAVLLVGFLVRPFKNSVFFFKYIA